ncbi:hypothetical protein D9M69_518670 [compost metagenome]
MSLRDEVIAIVEVLDDRPDFPIQRLGSSEAAVSEDDHIAPTLRRMRPDEDRCVLPTLPNCRQEIIEIVFVIFKAVADE